MFIEVMHTMTIRQQLEQLEQTMLAPQAAFSAQSRGRLREEAEDPNDVRTCYQ